MVKRPAKPADRRIARPIVITLLPFLLSLACSEHRPAFDPVTMDPPHGEGPAALLWEGSFESEGKHLNAIAYEARGPGPHPTLILLHGFPGNERNLDLAQAMRRAGWNVVFFHYRGAWGSGGDFSFSGALADVLAVAQAISEPEWARTHRVDAHQIAVVGHSMGGFLALAAASRDPRVRCAVSMAGPNLARLIPPGASPALLDQTGMQLEAWANGRLAGATGPALIADLSQHASELDLIELAPGLRGKPILLIGGRSDQVVPPDSIRELKEAYGNAGKDDVEMVILEGDHSFSEQRIELTRRVLSFLDTRCR